MTPAELLAQNDIKLENTAPGRYYTTCPKCSHKRNGAAHQKAEVLGVTINRDTVRWGCNHCGWTGPEKGNGKCNRQGSEFAATYDYRDANGVVRFQKVRNPPGSKPRFFMRRPDGNGGWITNLDGIDTSLLYRFDEVKEAIASGRRIAVVEGEKDADNLWAIGVPATCNAHGASEPGKAPKWTKRHSEQLRGANIVVFNDNDRPGYAHADATCRFSAGVAARIYRLDLAQHWPNMPPGKDVSDWLHAGHTREELDALIAAAPDYVPQPGPPDEGVPELIINSSDPTATAKALATLIAKRNDFLFNGYAPIRIADETGWLPRALEVTTEMVRVLAHEICTPTKVRTTRGVAERIPVPLSKDIAQLYLQGLEGSWGLKPFHGINTAPLLSDDGGIRVARGYDAQSGLWCHDIPDIIVPAEPTRNDVEYALRKLRETFRTFPFADAARLSDPGLTVEVVDPTKPAGLDESSFLVALLTGVCRQSLDLAPGFLCDAPNFSGAGTGKGLLVKAICVIASGVRPSAFTSGHDAEEFDKRLTAALIEAHPAVFLDNFNSKDLSSDILASVLTESPAVVRPMGHTKTVPLHTRTFIGITGNSVQIAEDMARRLLNTHLDAHLENPEQRKFPPGFLDRIFVERANLLAAALTIWRWGRQNKCEPGKPLGSYEVWAQWCRDPLLALGMRDPVDRIAEIKAADPKRRALVAIFDLWSAVHGDLIIKASDLGQEVIKAIDDKATVRADGGLQYSRQRVAGFLAGHVNTRVGGYALTKVMLGPPSKEVAHYKLTQDRNTTRSTLP
jgi:hypothetical protein